MPKKITMIQVMWEYFYYLLKKKKYSAGELMSGFEMIDKFAGFLEGKKGYYACDFTYADYQEYDEKYIQTKVGAEREALAGFVKYVQWWQEKKGK